MSLYFATASKVWQFSPSDFTIRFGQLLVVTPHSSGPSKYDLNLKMQTVFVKIIKCDHCEFLANTPTVTFIKHYIYSKGVHS